MRQSPSSSRTYTVADHDDDGGFTKSPSSYDEGGGYSKSPTSSTHGDGDGYGQSPYEIDELRFFLPHNITIHTHTHTDLSACATLNHLLITGIKKKSLEADRDQQSSDPFPTTAAERAREARLERQRIRQNDGESVSSARQVQSQFREPFCFLRL